MDKTYLKTLELDKILAQAAEYATCAEARALLVEQPACENAEETRFALSQTDAINSLLLKNGVPMKQIQEWLGHSDFSTTANIYAHLDAGSKLTSAQAMEKGLGMSSEVLIE